MVRLNELPEHERDHLLSKECPPFATQPWVTGPPLAQRRVALITSAGLHRRGDQHFYTRTGAYRVIPSDIEGRELVMSQVSVNFDRTGFQQDINVVLPIDRLRGLHQDGVIGSIATHHYSFMGAGIMPEKLEPTAREVAALLRQDGVDAVLLTPV
ncbi:MAG: glycine/betaine/sarcosine/D-proline family reductase selenoprotein B [Candidatus Tectomicrobia bacterium]|nr:glycine/betaine/sarcosine/D-proline family reductase selenoprotein B [Candidatus Tectomicrobia bacterium]